MNSKIFLQEQLNLVLEDSASEDEPIISSEEESVADKGNGVAAKKKILRRRSRCESPDFHGFESWTEEAEYVKLLEGFRR